MGLEYLPGGVESGFAKMEKDVYRTRLLHVKGKRVVRSCEVNMFSIARRLRSLDDGSLVHDTRATLAGKKACV